MPSRSRTRRSGTRAIAASALAVLAVASTGCSKAAHSFGPDAPTARGHADGLFLGLGRRFGPHSRNDELLAVRPKLLRHFLTPAAIWRDDDMWSAERDSTRTLAVAGELTEGGYILAKQADVPRPDRIGEARHLMHLTHVEGDVYEWESTDQLAIGTVRARDLYAVATGALHAIERADSAALRRAIATIFPRASAEFGRLFSIDTLRTTPLGDGSTTVRAAIRLDPGRIEDESPKLAEYLDRYVSSLRYRLEIDDALGVPWLRANLEDGLVTLDWRTRGGKLQPLEGRLRDAPPVFRLRASIFVKVLLFTVGASDIEAELRVIDRPHARGWEISFRDEPEWHIPLAGERLLRAPLRRPFEGEGALLRYVARDSAGAQTLLVRDIRAQVQESAPLRFLNSLGSKMASDFDERTEAELLAFTSAAIAALHRDVITMLPEEPRISEGRNPGRAPER